MKRVKSTKQFSVRPSLFIAGIVMALPNALLSGTAQGASVELVQHAALSPFGFTVTESNPSFSGAASFDAFKYGAYGSLLSSSLNIQATSDWSFGWQIASPTGFFKLETVTSVDASKIGGPANFTSTSVEVDGVWKDAQGPYPPQTYAGSDTDSFSQTFTPGGAGASITYSYGWMSNGTGATWDSLSESITVTGSVDYKFSIQVVLPKSVFNNTFDFDVSCAAGSMCFYDPDVATGFIYEASGTTFTELMVPGEYGDGMFSLLLFNKATNAYDLPGTMFSTGETVDLTQFDQGGLAKLKIGGIEPSAGVDPTNQTGFATGFSFSSNTGSFAMTAEIFPVPEPETYALMLAGLGLVGFAARRRVRNDH